MTDGLEKSLGWLKVFRFPVHEIAMMMSIALTFIPVLLEETKHFSDTGAYTMRISHGMRDSLLRGVTDIGLEILRNGKE